MVRFIIVMYKFRLLFMPSVILNGSTGRVNHAKINLRKQIKFLEAELVLIKADKRDKHGQD